MYIYVPQSVLERHNMTEGWSISQWDGNFAGIWINLGEARALELLKLEPDLKIYSDVGFPYHD